MVSARKAGLAIANADYIGFVDGDDYIEREMYEKLYSKIIEDGSDMVHSGYKKNDETYILGTSTSAVYGAKSLIEKNRIYKEKIFCLLNDDSISPSIWSKLFKRNIIINSYDAVNNTQSYGEDLLCLCQSIIICNKISVINEAYYHYVSREGSITNEKNVSSITREYSLYNCINSLFVGTSLYPEIKGSIDTFFLRNLSNAFRCISPDVISQYMFPNIEELYGKKIVIFGAGTVGQDYYRQISKYSKCRIVAWADSNYSRFSFDYCDIKSIDCLCEIEYDVIVIAALMASTADSIKESLLMKEILPEKIIWHKPKYLIE